MNNIVIKSLLIASIVTFLFSFLFSRTDYYYRNQITERSDWEFDKKQNDDVINLDKKEWILKQKEQDIRNGVLIINTYAEYAEDYDNRKNVAGDNIKDFDTRRVYNYFPLFLTLIFSFSASYLYQNRNHYHRA